MLEMSPHSRARWLHNHSFLFWVILLWSGHCLAWDLNRIICSAHHSAYCPHLVFLSSFLTMLYWPCWLTVFHRLQNTQHSHPQVLILHSVPKIKRKLLLQLQMLSASCHMPILLSALQIMIDIDKILLSSTKHNKNLLDWPKPKKHLISCTAFFQSEIEGLLSV